LKEAARKEGEEYIKWRQNTHRKKRVLEKENHKFIATKDVHARGLLFPPKTLK
jgi:hypothetical protein